MKFFIESSLKFLLEDPIDNKPSLVQVMDWRRKIDKPLPETMMTQSSGAYMRHQPSVRLPIADTIGLHSVLGKSHEVY